MSKLWYELLIIDLECYLMNLNWQGIEYVWHQGWGLWGCSRSVKTYSN